MILQVLNILLRGMICLCSGALVTQSRAQLVWDISEVVIAVLPSEESAVAKFGFKNNGTSPVRIQSITASCSCLSVSAEKREVPPGARGVVVATFTSGNKTGTEEKTILVESTDPKSPKTVLTLKVNVPEVAQVRPTFVHWENGATDPKQISVTIMNDFPVKKIEATPSHPGITAKVEVIKPQKEYRITVTPPESAGPVTATIKIQTDYPPENAKAFFVHVRVR